MIPPFHNAVDAACSYLSTDGFMGVADFYVSAKYDLPMRQMTWLRRFFWRCVAAGRPWCAAHMLCVLYAAASTGAGASWPVARHAHVRTRRATFDTDNIDIGPERRAYLEQRLERCWEVNSQVSRARRTPICTRACAPASSIALCALLPQHAPTCNTRAAGPLPQGSIPYVPYLRAPYYVWVGRHHVQGREWAASTRVQQHPRTHAAPPGSAHVRHMHQAPPNNMLRVLTSVPTSPADVPHENKVDRPALFPPTFLYTQSWEDPEPDMQVRARRRGAAACHRAQPRACCTSAWRAMGAWQVQRMRAEQGSTAPRATPACYPALPRPAEKTLFRVMSHVFRAGHEDQLQGHGAHADQRRLQRAQPAAARRGGGRVGGLQPGAGGRTGLGARSAG